ncbi:membrane-associated protein, putative [Bodo saltans]|uniref:Membrane-associated protein, putative n=1 Tax=Bodo saltans TaxID=75058 RepID=A0A0S4KIT0_BODSA|nr:membrane-associated protein, putative [Bodo saltans]|eukprot:CUI15544.1 membrane-associated protein, putative [Bodo saltans]
MQSLRLVACEMAKSLRLVVFLVMYRVALLQAEVVVLFAVECVRDPLFATFFFC